MSTCRLLAEHAREKAGLGREYHPLAWDCLRFGCEVTGYAVTFGVPARLRLDGTPDWDVPRKTHLDQDVYVTVDGHNAWMAARREAAVA